MLDLFLIYLRSTNSSSPPPPPKKNTHVTPSCLPPQSVHGSLPTTAMSPRTAVNFQVSPTVSVLSNTTLHTVRPRNLHRPLSVLQCLESNCFLLPVSLTVKKKRKSLSFQTGSSPVRRSTPGQLSKHWEEGPGSQTAGTME